MPTALIVEDEPEANQLLAMLVRLRGYSTTSAFTGAEALASVAKARPDLVFLDLMLPDANGLDLCRTLKSDGRTTAIPVIMVTARLASENRIQGFRAGATEYVPKPYTPEQIFRAMTQADAWRKQVEGDPESISIQLGDPGDVNALRDLGRLRSTLLARNLKLDPFLQGLAELVKGRGRAESDARPVVLDYHRKGDRITLTIRDLVSNLLGGDPARPNLGGASVGPSEAFATLIESGPFDESRIERVDGLDRLILTCWTGSDPTTRNN